MDQDQDAMRDRVCILERKVLEQNDEIVCLRTTLTDVLRRLNQMETSRSQFQKVILSMMEGLKDCNDWDSFAGHFGYAGTPGAKKEVTGRGRSGSAAAAAAVAAVAGTGGSPAGTGPSAALGRRSTVHQSATSLIVGDGNSTSSNGGSPVASPSPQQNQHHLIIGKRFMAVVGRFFVSFGLRLDCC